MFCETLRFSGPNDVVSVLSLIDVTYKLMGKVPFDFNQIAKKYEMFIFVPLVHTEK
jgi:hypothetical protein